MNARLVRNVWYPLQERLRGRSTFRLLAELEISQWWPRQALHRLQARKLRRILCHLGDVCTYYRRWFNTNGLDARGDDPFTILSALPLLDKNDLRAHARDLTPEQVPGGARTMTTGGSTGEPLTFRVDRRREAYDKAARMRSHRWFGVEPGDPEVYLWAAPIANRRQDLLRSIRDFFVNDLLLSAFDLSPERMQRYLGRIETFNPACIFGYPSSVALICNWATEHGLRVRLPRLKAVFVTGEVLDDQQRLAIESFFQVPVANGYGGRESGLCAHQCPAGGMHVTSEHVILEILDEDGQSLEPGQVGEIVVTNLDNLATPFIRYRTGDMGALTDHPCSCGRGSEMLADVRGRRTDHLVAADGSLRHALSAIYVLRGIEDIRQFQICQRADRSIDLHIAPHGSLREQGRARALAGIQKCVGASLPIRLHVTDRIIAQASGKYRYVVSEASAERWEQLHTEDRPANTCLACDRGAMGHAGLARRAKTKLPVRQ